MLMVPTVIGHSKKYHFENSKHNSPQKTTTGAFCYDIPLKQIQFNMSFQRHQMMRDEKRLESKDVISFA